MYKLRTTSNFFPGFFKAQMPMLRPRINEDFPQRGVGKFLEMIKVGVGINEGGLENGLKLYQSVFMEKLR